jgi:hypothetical protein
MATPAELKAAQDLIDAEKEAQKVTFDERQQAKVTELIIAGKSEAAKELRAEHAALKAETDALKTELAAAKAAAAKAPVGAKKDAATADVEALQAQIAEMKAVSESFKTEKEQLVAAANRKAQETTEARAEITRIKRDAEIKSAAGQHGFYNPDDVAALTSGSIRYDESRGKYIVVGDGDQPRLNAQMEPMSLDEYYADYASKHKYMVRSDFKGGVGSVTGTGSSKAGMTPLEDLFGPKSNGALAQKLGREDPAEYRRRRAHAVEAGLIG